MTEVVGTSETGIGVSGLSQGGDGVQGRTKERNHSGGGFVNEGGGQGVFGFGSPGVKGQSGVGDGVQGVTSDGGHSGAAGLNSGAGNGVFGQSESGRGVAGISNTGRGVEGVSNAGDGVFGQTGSKDRSGVTGFNTGGGRGLTAVGSPAGHFDGDVEVTGDIRLINADIAEDFALAATSTVEPGTVIVLDADGELRESNAPYDNRVAGVVSGAGEYKPAIILDRRATLHDRVTVALMGKVLCNVDADETPIEVGDLLTTSSCRGYAMKATDPARAFGAVIGKALRPLSSGRGKIPVLVALQ